MSIRITDVTLRDGLQMESPLPLSQKLKLYQALLNCGFSRLEVTSFVHPKWVPQFQDAEDFLKEIFKKPVPVELMAFVPNTKGLERFLNFPLPWVSCFVAASKTFNQKNVNQGIEETLRELGNVVVKARAEKRKVRIYISTVFGCPYEGVIDTTHLNQVLRQVADLNPDEIALSDTIGVAVPSMVKSILKSFNAYYPVEQTALHMHNTYGMGLVNVEAGMGAGITSLDGSTAGVGGCPYAKGATGNLASDEIQYLAFREKRTAKFYQTEFNNVYQILTESKVKTHSSLSEIQQRGGTVYGGK